MSSFPFGVDVGAFLAGEEVRQRWERVIEGEGARWMGAYSAPRAGSRARVAQTQTLEFEGSTACTCGGSAAADSHPCTCSRKTRFACGRSGRSPFTGSRQATSADAPLGGSEEPVIRHQLAADAQALALLERFERAGRRWRGPPGTNASRGMGWPGLPNRFGPFPLEGDGADSDLMNQPEGTAGCDFPGDPNRPQRRNETDVLCSDQAQSDSVNVLSSCTSKQAELIRAAWCMLRDSSDLVEWVTDIVYGEDVWGFEYGDLIVGYLNAAWPFRVDVGCDDSNTGHASVPAPGLVVFHFGEDTGPAAALERFDCSRDEACMVVAMAATLYHELLHVGGVAPLDSQESGYGSLPFCEQTVDIAHGAMLWALLTRYSVAMASGCCQWHFSSADGPPSAVPDPALWLTEGAVAEWSSLGCGAC